MTTVKEFTPVLMYVDHERIDATLKSAKEHAERINRGLSQIEDLLETELSDQEKLELLQNGFPYLQQRIKEQFQFPKAPDQFNLESMGKVQEFEQSKSTMSQICAAFQAYDYTVEAGTIVLTSEGNEAITEKNTHYTKNEAQTDAFKLAEKLVKDLNKAKDREWITRYDVEAVRKGIKIIDESGGKFVPHYRNISNLNAAGALMSEY